MDVFGSTRSQVRPNYALITPDTHVPAPLLGWENATAYFHITPEMGARFIQYTAVLSAGGKSAMPHESVERFIYVLEGGGVIEGQKSAKPVPLRQGSYAYFPAGSSHVISTSDGAKLFIIEK